MFGPPYRILFSIIIGWAILLFIYPIIAAIIGLFSLGTFFSILRAMEFVMDLLELRMVFMFLLLIEIRSHLDFGFVFCFVLSAGWLLVD
jgi:hypothetical protein